MASRGLGRKWIGLALAVVVLGCPTVVQAYPPSDSSRQARLINWQFEFLAQPINVRVEVASNSRRGDINRLRSSIRNYLDLMTMEFVRWQADDDYEPRLFPFMDYLTGSRDEPPAWYQRLRIFQPPRGGFIGFSPTDLNQMVDGGYHVPPNRTVP